MKKYPTITWSIIILISLILFQIFKSYLFEPDQLNKLNNIQQIIVNIYGIMIFFVLTYVAYMVLSIYIKEIINEIKQMKK